MKKLFLLSAFAVLLLASCEKEKTDEQLGINAVDLSLSVEWCDRNVGALSPDAAGTYYAWGETKVRMEFGADNYKWGNVSAGEINKYNGNDGLEFLEASDDIAHAKFGGKWRMPTADEWLELCEKCDWKWTKQGKASGFLVTSKDGSTSIFLPAAGGYLGSSLMDVGYHGFYWTSQLIKSSPASAWAFWIRNNNASEEDFPRYYGFPIRAVKDKQ